jgi:methylglutaconyl-CoA hydratase
MLKSSLTVFSWKGVHRFASTNAANILVERFEDGKIVHLALNRHDGKNSFSKQMLADFTAAVAEVQQDKNVRAVVLKSTVDKVFCAGADLKERATMPDSEVAPFVAKLRSMINQVSKIPVPVIAAIDGAALGGGLELALACDIRIAGEKALLGLTETALGIIPGAGGTQRLPRVVGLAKAKQLIFTAARLNSKQAAAIGLVGESVEGRPSAERAHEIALEIAEKGPIAIRMAKKALDEGMQLPLQEALDKVETECYGGVVNTADRKEGLLAFKEKRKPNYQGK